jgi:hypothetical protein
MSKRGRFDGTNELQIDIPRGGSGPDLEFSDPNQDQCFETSLGGINDLIQNLTSSLQVCEKKSRAYGSSAVPSVKEMSSRYGSHEVDPTVAPENWWDSGIKYVFEWIREIWMERVACAAKEQIDRSGITFFTWKEYTGKVTMDAAAYSLAMMLKKWTPADRLVTDESCPPVGVEDRKEDAQTEVKSLVSTAERIIKQFEKDSLVHSASNPPLSEILAGCANAMRTLLMLQQKECEYLAEHRKDVRYFAVVAVNAVTIVQKWIFDQSLCKLKKALQYYRTYNDQIKTSFSDPMRRLTAQRDKFRTLWEQVKSNYDAFLASQGLKDRDESAVDAMDVLFFSQNGDEFGIESVKLMKNYVKHMRRLAYSNVVGKRPRRRPSAVKHRPSTLRELIDSECGDKGDDDAEEGSQNPVKELHTLYEKKKTELDALNREIKTLKEKCGDSPDPSQIQKIEALEDKRKKIVKSAESSIKILKNYSEYPMDDHNKWLDALEKLEDNLERAVSEWGKIYRQKYRREAQLEEEIRSYLHAIMDSTYHSYDRDTGRVMSMWHDKQSKADKTKDEDVRQICMERYVAQEWLQNYERKLVYYSNNSSSYIKSISEFKAVHSMIATSRETVYKICDFEDAYDDLVHLWKVAYEVGQCDGDVTDDYVDCAEEDAREPEDRSCEEPA